MVGGRGLDVELLGEVSVPPRRGRQLVEHVVVPLGARLVSYPRLFQEVVLDNNM